MTLMMQNHTFQNTNNSEKTRNKTFDKNMFAWIYLPKWKRFNFGEHAKGAQKITYKCSDVSTCNLLVLFYICRKCVLQLRSSDYANLILEASSLFFRSYEFVFQKYK